MQNGRTPSGDLVVPPVELMFYTRSGEVPEVPTAHIPHEDAAWAMESWDGDDEILEVASDTYEESETVRYGARPETPHTTLTALPGSRPKIACSRRIWTPTF